MGYTYYNPLKVWLDPASIADVVSYMQKYLSENPIKDTEEINQIIADYIAAHPEIIGGVQSVNGETGDVVLTASDINTIGETTIQAVLTSLSSQISDITPIVTQNSNDIHDLQNAVDELINTETKTGTLININPSYGEKIQSIDFTDAVTDNLSLYIYNKNLFTKDTNFTNKNGLVYTINRDSEGRITSINIDGTATKSTFNHCGQFTFKANIDYFISAGGDSSSAFRFALTQTSGGSVVYNIGQEGLHLNFNEDTTYYLNTVVSSGTVCDNFKLYPQIEIGTQQTEYEGGEFDLITLTNGVYDGNSTLKDGQTNLYVLNSSNQYVEFTVIYGDGGIKEEIENVSKRVQSIEDDNYTADRYALRESIPSYFIDNTTDDVLYLSDKINDYNELSGNVKFTFWTDSHWLWASQNSMEVIGYVNNWLGIQKLFYGGDILGNGGNTTKLQAEYLLEQHQNRVRDIFKKGFYYAFGNHDINQSGGIPDGMDRDEFLARALSFEFVYNNCIAPYSNNGQIFKTAGTVGTELYYWNRLTYYLDDDTNKIRYIVLNSGTPHNPLYENGTITQNNTAELYLQLDWLYDTLMSCRSGYSVIVIAHEFSGILPDMDTPAKSISKMLVAMKNKAECTVQSGLSSSTTKTFDFSDATADVIMMLCGHAHTDACIVCAGYDDNATYTAGTAAGQNSILCVFTTCDTRNNKQEVMPLGTVNEIAFDLFKVNQANRTIYTVRVGYGSDRVFTY